MNKTEITVVAVVCLIVGTLIGLGIHSTEQTGGDFAGGVLPTTLITGTAAGGPFGSGYVQPVGSLAVAAPNGLSTGGTSQYNAVSAIETASGTPASVVTLGAFGTTTSTASSSITVPNTAGLTVGDICEGGSNNTSTFITGCSLQSTNGATGTAMIVYGNLLGATTSVPTSTLFRIKFSHLPY